MEVINPQPQNNDTGRTVIIREQAPRTNGMGTAGFVLALLSVLLGWIPVVGWAIGWILWILGFVFSFIGLFKAPRGLAIAGLVISLIGIVVLLVFVAGVAGMALLSA